MAPAVPESAPHPPPHPFLLADAARWRELRDQLRNDLVAQKLAAAARARADATLELSVVPYVKAGNNILDAAREAQGRIYALAMSARLTGDSRYSARARAELLHAAEQPDWNNGHFLDTAELALALAVGLDWLHDEIPPAERALLEDALLAKALRPSVDQDWWWLEAGNNWAQVCHAGLTAGALVVAHREPALARRIVERAIAAYPKPAHAYAPDGAYTEGPNYWGYGTSFHVIMIELLRHAFGTSHDLEKFPGFMAGADYINHMTTPTGAFFNYADARAHRPFQPALFWFASERDQPQLAAHDCQLLDSMLTEVRAGSFTAEARHFPLALLWWKPGLTGRFGEPASRPLHWSGAGKNPVGVHRTAWGDRNAVFVAVKGGTASNPHGHMDAGSFILEAEGVRWAVDPGLQEYATLQSLGDKLWDNQHADSARWKVFRLGPEAHNILRFGGCDPLVKGSAHIEHSDPLANGGGETLLNLSPVYADVTAEVRRAVRLLPDGCVRIHDEWCFPSERAVRVTSQWLTFADVAIAGDTVTLRQEGRTLTVRAVSAGPVAIAVDDMTQPTPLDSPNPGLKRLRFEVAADATRSGRLALHVTPGSANPAR